MSSFKWLSNKVNDSIYSYWYRYKTMSTAKRLWYFFLVGFVFAFFAAAFIGLQLIQLPKIDALIEYEPRVVTTVYDWKDKVIGEFSTEQRIELKENEIPEVIKH